MERDLAGEPPEVREATRARIASAGWGDGLLAAQDRDGRWAGVAWLADSARSSVHSTLNALKGPAGQPSKWLTLLALRVLNWRDRR
ncbi:hypothetical protein [Amycolatopsis sp. NPDC051716]|uniref:hypothetical protein n=1 Tax=Amycolatopsis sp. NPDC051716 TaxID=3155804 RepID=UPI00342D261F